jgi:hypothetical protein
MTTRNVPPAGRSDASTESAARPPEESLAANRLVSLLGRIRDGARQVLDAVQSDTFCGSLDEVFPVYREDVSVAVSYLVKLGVSHEEVQQLWREYERAWDAGGSLQLFMQFPAIAIDYPASDDDPDDPEVARVKQVNAERRADHQQKVDDQRGIAVDAFSALFKRVEDLTDAVELMPRGRNDQAATAEASFLWRPPMLEGYVFALLKEVEDPSERDAVAWISNRSGKLEPARATLRKTYAWQNRPQKTPKPRTTNEAQSGVSLVENADAAVSHEEVTNAVLDIQEKLQRQLADNEQDAVAWTLQQAGADEVERDEAIHGLIQGFRSGNMCRNRLWSRFGRDQNGTI